MQEVVTVSTMRESDAHTIASYVPSRTLMYRAAMGVYKAVNWQEHPGLVGILTGGGNNGGDGYALAGILAEHKIPCRLYTVSEQFSADGRYYYDLARKKGVEAEPFGEATNLSGCAVLVDCLLGTGFHGTVRGNLKSAIQAVNASGAYVVSVDINSGMNGDTGKGGPVVKSKLTVTIGSLKTGMLLGDAVWSIGGLAIADIGIRLIREDVLLAKPEEIIFPNTGFSLNGEGTLMLTPGEVEDQEKNGQTPIDVAQELALRSRRLVRVLGKYPLVTDGYRTYFVEEGVYPKTVVCREEI